MADPIKAHLPDPGDQEIRRSGIGGSDAAAIVGLNPFRSALDVYLDKRGLTEDLDSEAAEWGRILEPVILRQYAIRQECWVLGRDEGSVATLWHPDGLSEVATDCGYYLDTLRDPDRQWRMCHLDGVVVDREGYPLRLIEGKTSSAWRGGEWGDEGTDEVPREYIVQCAHNAGVFRAQHALTLPVDVVALIGGQKFRVYQVNYQDELDARLIELEQEFWQRVEDGNPPAPTPDEVGQKALARLYPQDEGEERLVSPSDPINETAAMLHAARTDQKTATEARTGHENELKAEMKDCSAFVGDGWKATWKKTRDGEEVDWEAAFKALAHDYVPTETAKKIKAEHTTPKPGTRRFVFRWTKEGD